LTDSGARLIVELPKLKGSPPTWLFALLPVALFYPRFP